MLNINNKQWNELRATDVKKQLAKIDDENFFFEWKADDIKPDHFIQEVSAFANTYGGYILLGVDNDKNISGCSRWTEQRIHSVMHDSITPTPIFDVKRFNVNRKKVFVVKIEEGTLPPYITNKGEIYERLSSGSFKIKDSAKLAQIYNKQQTQYAIVREKLALNPLPTDVPSNLCAYIDYGFSIVYSTKTNLQKNFYNFDFQPICDYLNSTKVKYSISRVGTSIFISFGSVTTDNNYVSEGMHNFIIIMIDGSVKGRTILGHQPQKSSIVDITLLFYTSTVFREIYKLIFGESIFKSFIYAQKYEKLNVLKQFTPIFNVDKNNPEYSIFAKYLPEHRKKYGNNLIVCDDRYPTTGFQMIDKRFFDEYNIQYDFDSLITQLFPHAYMALGYIDAIKK